MNCSAAFPLGIALLLAFTAAASADEPARAGPVRVGFGLRMPLLKVEEGSITVRTRGTDTGGGGEMTLSIDKEKTKVFVGVVTDRKELPDGRVATRVERRPATLADLKVGQQVKVSAVQGYAAEIDIMPPPEKKQAAKEKPPEDAAKDKRKPVPPQDTGE